MEDLGSNDTATEIKVTRSNDERAKKKGKRSMPQVGDAMSSLKDGPSSSKEETTLIAKRKLDKAKKKSPKKKRAKVDISIEDEDCDEAWYDFSAVFTRRSYLET